MRLVVPGCVHDARGIPALRIFVLVCAMALYLTMGASVFQAIEAPLERELEEKMAQIKMDFLRDHPCVSDDDLELLLNEVVRASNRGVSASRNVSGGPNWSFGQSLFFSSTVVTTIGYGHVTPLSKPGKLFCMMYALLGIPLTLVLLTALVERLLQPATAMLRALNASLGHLYRPFTIRLVHLMIIVTSLVVSFLVIPATIFAALEPDWDFLDSFYYCFISLTTIGLGDYIPGDSPGQEYRPLYKVATTFYLLIGLTFLMLTLTVFYDIPQLNLSTVFSSVKLDEDPEKMRLSGSGVMGPGYGIGGLVMRDDYNHHDQRRSVVHIRPHLDDSPSPEDTTPVHARDMRVH
ncbi:potassium channel subfamily K member 1-like isoform X2 [Plodia interpunctella]|uniref:potassium channel subfamily K member 1-like isoform X2 n=1 Tax=Plodia interpunctella TaxID=58824 RepID=UPI0023685F91|nr:potassium channel subfamily K member 1-like isoform X2 [Plodia interpunctella]